MGIYDFVLIEPDVEIPDYPLSTPPDQLSWQTRAFTDPMYRLHCIAEDGYLYRADHNYESNGLAEAHGDTGAFEFLEKVSSEEYTGYPRGESEFSWYRIRYVGEMRITAQSSETSDLVTYDVDFDRHSINKINRIKEQDMTKTIRSKMGNLEPDDISDGDIVFDHNTNKYEVVEILDEKAKDFIAKPEVTDRGHTIYREKTVADLNSDYPEDDLVVTVRRVEDGSEFYFPISRIGLNPEDIF